MQGSGCSGNADLPNFDQAQAFTSCIQHAIHEYGGGDVMIRELLVNADDAGAKHFFVVLDKSQYSTTGLVTPGLASLQGPALLLGNDARFSHRDRLGLTQRIGNSFKAGDPDTAGQFGKGSLTVYSVTEVIQLLSDDQLLILDPQGTHLGNGIHSWHCQLDEIKEILDSQAPSQLEPFMFLARECSELVPAQSQYPETIFRLALRTPEAAQSSLISNKSSDLEQIASIVTAFAQIAADLLLFLRSVQKISVYVKDSPDSPATRVQYCLQSTTASELHVGQGKLQNMVIQADTGSGIVTKHWAKILSNVTTGNTDGVAVLLSATDDQHEQLFPILDGKVCSTIPLPYRMTGLPMHINGAFSLTWDRRNLWHGEGSSNQEAHNVCVLEQGVAPAWASMLSHLGADPTDHLGHDLYRLFPSTDNIEPVLLITLAAAVIECLMDQDSRVLWVPPSDASEPSAGRRISIKQACFEREPNPCVTAVARHCGMDVPDISVEIFKVIKQVAKKKAIALTFLTPDKLRQALKAAHYVVKPSECDEILAYAVSDDKLSGMDQLHLLRLCDDSIGQILSYGTPSTTSTGRQTKAYYYFTNDDEKALYDLMIGSPDLLVAESATFTKLSKMTYQGQPLFASRSSNVCLPTASAVANSLPAAWTGTCCTPAAGTAQALPNQDWLDKFWGLVAKLWNGQVPQQFYGFMVVPLKDNRLASPAYCSSRAALTSAHLAALPPAAAEVLSAVGCLCIAQPAADRLSRIRDNEDAVAAALTAVSRSSRQPLNSLVSVQHLGQDRFDKVRQFLADYVGTAGATDRNTWDFLKHCTIFEDGTGSMTSYAGSADLRIMPSASWEQQLPELQKYLPGTYVVYHSGSEVQKTLIRSSCIAVPSVQHFLVSVLFPNTTTAGNSGAEPFLLQGLEEAASLPSAAYAKLPTSLFVQGSFHPVVRLVDSSSQTLTQLFPQQKRSKLAQLWQAVVGKETYQLLPAVYTTEGALQTLRKMGLRHEAGTSSDFFMTCVYRFQSRIASLSRQQQVSCSQALVRMLSTVVSYYYPGDRIMDMMGYSQWASIRLQLCNCPIFMSAQLQFPYDLRKPDAWVSLAGSLDFSQRRLVANAIAVTSNVYGDTNPLRSKLYLPDAPEMLHVVDHLLQTAASDAIQQALQKRNTDARRAILLDVNKAYQFIFDKANIHMTSPTLPTGYVPTFTAAADKLAKHPWVLVDGHKFCLPSKLCFNVDEDATEGYAVPAWILAKLQAKPLVRQWMVEEMGVTDVYVGVPPVKQPHPNSVLVAGSTPFRLAGMFNNQQAYPDAIIFIGDEKIYLHRVVIRMTCPSLAQHFDACWSNGPIRLDGLGCPECNITVSHSTALTFLEFLYTGSVKWSQEPPDCTSASELLLLADMYNVPYLVCEAEVALKANTDFANCCAICNVADHHNAEQLRAYSIHFIRASQDHVKQQDDYQYLRSELRAEVENA